MYRAVGESCMSKPIAIVVELLAAASMVFGAGQDSAPGQALTANELQGLWVGSVSHQGESSPLALDLEPGDDGTASVKLSIPVIHLHQVPLGRLPLAIEGDRVRVGPFALTLDRAAGTLRGTVPEHLAPVHELPFTLRRAERYDQPLRPRPTAPVVAPVWAYEAGAPLWAGPTVVDGLVVVAGLDGRVVAFADEPQAPSRR